VECAFAFRRSRLACCYVCESPRPSDHPGGDRERPLEDTQTVDIVSGINTAVNQLRSHLGDDPASPKYIETVIGSGYRFIASVVESPAKPEVVPSPALQLLASEEASLSLSTEPLSTAAPLGPESHRIARIRRQWALAGAAALVAASSVAYLLTRSAATHHLSPPALNMTRVTGNGDVQYADISPDGRYVAYVRETGGEQSLWLKQLATGRVLELVALGQQECQGLAFSPDGSYIYFARKAPLEASGELTRCHFWAEIQDNTYRHFRAAGDFARWQ